MEWEIHPFVALNMRLTTASRTIFWTEKTLYEHPRGCVKTWPRDLKQQSGKSPWESDFLKDLPKGYTLERPSNEWSMRMFLPIAKQWAPGNLFISNPDKRDS